MPCLYNVIGTKVRKKAKNELMKNLKSALICAICGKHSNNIFSPKTKNIGNSQFFPKWGSTFAVQITKRTYLFNKIKNRRNYEKVFCVFSG